MDRLPSITFILAQECRIRRPSVSLLISSNCRPLFNSFPAIPRFPWVQLITESVITFRCIHCRRALPVLLWFASSDFLRMVRSWSPGLPFLQRLFKIEYWFLCFGFVASTSRFPSVLPTFGWFLSFIVSTFLGMLY